MRSFILVLVFVFNSSAFATQQIKDVLNYKAKDYIIEQTPLSSFMPRTTLVQLLNLQEMCSASWEGYKAKWKIDHKYLYLTEIRKAPCTNGGQLVPLNVLFPGNTNQVKAIWFSGKITSYTGKSWSDNKESGMGDNNLLNYKYEIEVFMILDGVLVKKYNEIVKFE